LFLFLQIKRNKMATITFDTLKFANALKEAGVPPAQAEAEAIALSELLEVNLKDLVTKEDLRHEVELLRRDMRDMEQRLIIKLGALMAFSIGIVAALVKLL
jgi:2-phosphoglycerate kinase